MTFVIFIICNPFKTVKKSFSLHSIFRYGFNPFLLVNLSRINYFLLKTGFGYEIYFYKMDSIIMYNIFLFPL
jgi:hypothetical protein